MCILLLSSLIWAQEQPPALPEGISQAPAPTTAAPTQNQTPELATVPQNQPPPPPDQNQPPAPLKFPEQPILMGAPNQNAAPPAEPVANTPPPPPAENQPPPPLTTQNSVPLPPAASPKLQSDVAQFQNWLAKNGQKPRVHKIVRRSRPRLLKREVRTQVVIRRPLNPEIPIVQSPPLSYEQSRALMIKSAPPAPPPSPEAMIAFNSLLKQNMPLTPQQVVQLRQSIDVSQRAASIPANIPPKPVSGTIIVNLAPGSTPPVIRLAQGYISSLVFVDSSGAPWPIASYDLGDPKMVTIQWDGKSNILLMQANTPYGNGNLVLRFVGLETPVALELIAGQRVVDFRTDIHVPGLGPNSKELAIGVGLPPSANQLLLNVLDGVAPIGAQILTVRGADAQAWLVGDKMYLRTRFDVLSPGWTGKMSSPDGMIAYELQRTSSVLISQYGNPIELKIEGF